MTGIEKINLYGCSLYIPVAELAEARGFDASKAVNDYGIKNRSLNPLFEDTLTMAANAAGPLLDDQEREQIGLLIFATESAYDFGKPLSTNLIDVLRLNPNVRNFEIKHACYAATGAIHCALDWIRSGSARGKKAMVVASDFSRRHRNSSFEMITGGVAVALLLSDNPRIFSYDPGLSGTWSRNFYDTFRPKDNLEVVNPELSLFTYMEALREAYRDYQKNALDLNINIKDSPLDYHIYHMPFAGIALHAHRTFCREFTDLSNSQITEDFITRVKPSMNYASEVGSCYGAGNMVGLCGIIDSLPGAIEAGIRVGLFSYGSGAIGEFCSGTIMPEAKVVMGSMDISGQLDSRKRVSLRDYERIEQLRETYLGLSDYEPDMNLPHNCYQDCYRGKNKLYLSAVRKHERFYEWS